MVLEDPKNLFSSQNVTPLVYKDAVNDKAKEALNAVSAKLTTGDLLEMMKKLVNDKEDADDRRQGLADVRRPRGLTVPGHADTVRPPLLPGTAHRPRRRAGGGDRARRPAGGPWGTG